MKRVYLGNKELTALATVTNGGGGGGDDNQKWLDYFNGTLTEFTVPEGVTKIKDYAFNGCSSLTSVTIPNSVTSIGDRAFSDCSFTSVILHDNLTSIGYSAFYTCSRLTGVTIPNLVTSIGNYAFRDCNSLATVTIQNSTSKLKYNYQAFEGISSSAKLYVPSNLLSDYQSDSKWTGAFGGGIYAIQ